MKRNAITRLKATRALTYNTRRLLPGDEFEASDRDARLLIAIKKATAIRAPAHVPPPPPAVAEKIAAAVAPAPVATPTAPAPATVGAMTASNTGLVPQVSSDDLAPLRAEYETALGKKPFMGWSAEVLRQKMAEAKA